MSEYIGQLWGGPQHGNLVSATVKKFRYSATQLMYLDGPRERPVEIQVEGSYRWNADKGVFDWEGPGADGGTMERLRLR